MGQLILDEDGSGFQPGDVIRWRHRAETRSGKPYVYTYATLCVSLDRWFSSVADDNPFVERMMSWPQLYALLTSDECVEYHIASDWDTIFWRTS